MTPLCLTTIDKFAAIGAIQYGTDLLGLVNLMEPLGLYDPIKKVHVLTEASRIAHEA